MQKRSVYTKVTPLPPNVRRETVMETLHNHAEMIDLNALVEERHPIKPPINTNAEEYHCEWWSIRDKISYLPGGMLSGSVTYNACFHDLPNGIQTHCYAPVGVDIRGKWTLAGSLPGEPAHPVELGLGAPLHGLYIREDVDLRCNIVMAGFVRRTLQKSHALLVDRIVVKAKLQEAVVHNERLGDGAPSPLSSGGLASPMLSPASLRRSDTSDSFGGSGGGGGGSGSNNNNNNNNNNSNRISYQKLLNQSYTNSTMGSPRLGNVEPGFADASSYQNNNGHMYQDNGHMQQNSPQLQSMPAELHSEPPQHAAELQG